MTILPSTLHPTAPISPAESAVDGSGRANAGVSAASPNAADAAVSGDQLDLSDAARTSGVRPSTDAALETAQIALRNGSEMSDARLHDLRERVRTGHYDQPEAVGRIAEAAARDLTGSTPS